MPSKTSEALDILLGLTILGTLAAGISGVFYQSCLKKTTLEDVTVTSVWITTVQDYDNFIDYDLTKIKLDRYDSCLEIEGDIKKRNKFKRITYRNRFLFCPLVTDYEFEQ